MIRKTSLLRHESPCLPLKIFKLLNKREERRNYVGKTLGETLGAPVRLVEIIKA